MRGAFENDPALANVGGARYLADLAAGVITIHNTEDYARVIHDAFLRRQLILLSDDIAANARAQDLEKPAKAQIENAEQRLFELARSGEIDRGAVKLEKALAASVQMAERAFKRDNHITGVATGLTDLDRKLGGLQRSDLVILAGRPSMGKTALATTIAFNAARAFAETGGKDGAAILFFSLEMSAEQLATRLLGERSSIPADKIRRGEIKAADLEMVFETSKALSQTPLTSMTPLPSRFLRCGRGPGA